MKPLLYSLVLCCGLVTGTPGVAVADGERLTPQDFAWGIPLEVDGDGAIYSLELPEQVYRHVTRRDLGDLRVFNSNNAVVPHLLRREKDTQTVTREPVTLKLFPVYREAGGGAATAPEVRIVTDAGGTIIDISGGSPASVGQGKVVYAYVVDLGPALEGGENTAAARGPDWLEFDWQGAPDSFATRVSISASDDLDNWRTVVPATTLSHFRFDGNELQRRRIEVAGLRARYLKISWPAGAQNVLLRSIRAGFGGSLRESARRWTRLDGAGKIRRGDGGLAWLEYDAAAFLPVDRLRLRLASANSVARVTVLSRDDPAAPWRQRYAGVIYRLTVQGEEVENPVLRISPTQDRYWRVELAADEADSVGGIELAVGWRPHRLLFMASGEAPFRIAYGAAGVAPAGSAIPALLRQLGEDSEAGFVKAAQAGEEIELGGQGQMVAPTVVPWRRLVLWTVLVLGVGIVAFMVLRLAREMKGPQ